MDFSVPLERTQRFYLAPQHEIKAPILALARDARISIDIEIYGFALPELAQELIAAHRRGVKVRVVFDHTQACGVHERQLVAVIAAAGIEHYVGTSPRRQIRHSKFMVVDGILVEKGSLNYSQRAFAQNNTVDIVSDREMAAMLTADLETNIAWLVANEPQYQTAAGAAA